MERVKSADVLDPTHEAKRPFRGVVVGYFERIGPNAWDDYRFVRSTRVSTASVSEKPADVDESTPPSSQDVLPGVPLQLESRGTEVRMRSRGRVVRVRWLAEPSDIEAMDARAEPRTVRRFFVEQYLAPLDPSTGLGATAVMVKKLNE